MIMRIAHVTATFPPYFGGTGTVCYHNARVLAARGHDVHVFTADWPGAVEDPTGVTVHRMRPLVRIGNAPILPQLMKLAGFDLVHLHLPFYVGGELMALSQCRYLVTYHQDVALEGWLGKLSSLHDRTIGRFVLEHAERVCPTSIDYLRHSALAPLWHQHPERIVELPNGVDTEQFHPGPLDANIRRSLGLPLGAFIVLFVGAMDQAHYFKGIPTLLEALVWLPDTAAMFVGDGELREGFARQAACLGVADRVRFVGGVSDHELPNYYRAADTLVLPSGTRGEAFGLVLLEAMASGRPVIASNLPGVRTVITPGQDGFLVTPNSPEALAAGIQQLAALSPQQREAMGQAARAKVERRFSWETVGDHLEELYGDVVRATGSHPSKGAPASPMPHALESFEVRAALEFVVQRCSIQPGRIAATIVGDVRLTNWLGSYGTIEQHPDILVALSASPEELRLALQQHEPTYVYSLLPGSLDRPLRRLRTKPIPLRPDLPAADWRQAGYRRIRTTGFQGGGALACAVAARIAQRLDRSDLADRLRFAMLERLQTSTLTSRWATLTVQEYRRVA